MGTRNLTSVILDGQTRVAQMCQWDGYPTGQGETIAEFLRTADLAAFADRLRATRFITAPEVQAIADGFPHESPLGFTLEESNRFREAYPALHRDTGAGVLSLIADGSVTDLQDLSKFADDHLWCEWAYFIDLDAETVQVEYGMESRQTAVFSFAMFTAEGAMEAFEAKVGEES